jgi:AGZA family xanthine/uracil permease-like MFS transporter
MLDSYFKISERGSSVSQEIRGGLVTFFTMAYIVVLNPLIIGYTKDANGNYIGGSQEPQIAMIAAATEGNVNIIQYLIQCEGIDVNTNNGMALSSAAYTPPW